MTKKSTAAQFYLHAVMSSHQLIYHHLLKENKTMHNFFNILEIN